MNSPDKHCVSSRALSSLDTNDFRIYMVSTTITETSRIAIAKMEPGEDVLDTIELVAKKHGIESGHLTLIGALARAKLGYFDLENKVYKDFQVDEDVEVVSCMGNLSTLEDGSYVVHAHMIVADENGRCYGGHLMKGCNVSVTIELYLTEIKAEIKRGKDELTGLNLLQLE